MHEVIQLLEMSGFRRAGDVYRKEKGTFFSSGPGGKRLRDSNTWKSDDKPVKGSAEYKKAEKAKNRTPRQRFSKKGTRVRVSVGAITTAFYWVQDGVRWLGKFKTQDSEAIAAQIDMLKI